MQKWMMIAFGTLMLGPGAAFAWQDSVSIDYRMGDHESRTMAEQNAMEKLKVQAAAEAETYISREKTLKDGEISESIRAIGASLVGLDGIEKNLTLDDSGNMILSVAADAQIDDSVLADRIEAIQKDQSKQRAIERLAQENERLRDRLENASTGSAGEDLSDQLQSQSEIYKDLKENSESVEQVFSRGTLVSMAQNSKSEADKIKQKLRDSVLRAFTNATVSVDVESVTQKGGQYQLRLNLDSDINWRLVSDKLSELFEVPESDRQSPTLNVQRPSESDGADPAQVDAFDWFSHQTVLLNVEVGGQVEQFDLLSRTEKYDCGGPIKPGEGPFEDEDDKDKICIYDPAARGSAYPRYGDRRVDPIKVDVSESVAKSATSVEARYVVDL